MKASLVNGPGERSHGIVRGHVGRGRAGSSGIDVSDGVTTASEVTDIEVVGLAVADLGDGVAQIALATTFTNDAGADLATGDVVTIVGTTVQTTTTPQYTGPVGVVVAGGADGDPVVVQTSGIVPIVNVTAAVTANDYAETSSTAGLATENATPRAGSFGQFLTSGLTPRLLLFGQTYLSSGGAGGGSLDWFVVTDPAYGAVGDGTTDDTAAIQAAIDAAKVNGGVVYFPTGQYKITAALDVDPATASHHIRFVGTMPPDSATTYDAGSVIVQATSNTNNFTLTTNAYDTLFENLKIVGPSTHASGYGIYSPRNIHCNNVWVTRCAVGVYEGASSFYAKHYRLMVYGCTTGIVLDGSCNNVDFVASRIASCTTGLSLVGNARVAWFGGAIEGSGTYGIKIDSGSYITEAVSIIGCYFENSGAIDIRVGHSATVYAVTIQGCYFNSGATAHVDAQYVDGLFVTGNSLQQGTGARSKIKTASPAANVTLGYNTGTGSYGTMPASTIRLDPSQTFTPSDVGDANAAGAGPDPALRQHIHKLGGTVGGVLSGTLPNPSFAVDMATQAELDAVAASISASAGVSFTVIGQETRTSDGATVLWNLDNDFEPNSVQAFNLTSGKALVVTEGTSPAVTIGAAGTAGDTLAFAYAASVT